MATPSAAEEAASLHLPDEAATAAFGRALARLARPGDLIAMGTPEGVGPIESGDEVRCRIAGIGELINSVRREQPPAG